MPPRPASNIAVNENELVYTYYDDITDPHDSSIWRIHFAPSGMTVERDGKPAGGFVYSTDKEPTVKESDFDEVFS